MQLLEVNYPDTSELSRLDKVRAIGGSAIIAAAIPLLYTETIQGNSTAGKLVAGLAIGAYVQLYTRFGPRFS